MKKLLIKLLLFFIILFSIILLIVRYNSQKVVSKEFHNYDCESNLFTIKSNEQFDIAIVGISHARNFSRYKNQIKLESIFNQSIINLGIGRGLSSINEQLFYLTYFYKHQNRAKTLLFVLSPPMLYSDKLPLASNSFNDEPFRLDFLSDFIFYPYSENKFQKIISYLKSKASKEWLEYTPSWRESYDDKLKKVDKEEIALGFKQAYPIINESFHFQKNSSIAEKIIQLATKHKTKVILVIPPAVFGKWKFHEEVEQFGKKMAVSYKSEFYDFSEIIQNPDFYYDHHHLNTSGVVFLSDSFLKPILTK